MQNYDPEQAFIKAQKTIGAFGGVTPSVSRSSTFTFNSPDTMKEVFQGEKTPEKDACFLYSRHYNPTVKVLDNYLAAIEGTESAISTSSGMSAIASAILQLCKTGDHIISSDTIYGGSYAFINQLLSDIGVKVTFVDITRPELVENAIKTNTKIVFTETIANPTLQICDIPFISKITKQNNIKLIVDNTFSPMVVTPAKLGADIVVYSMTKYINGGSDLIAGAICASKDFIDSLMDLRNGRIMLLGPTIDPRVAFDIIQRLPHLGMRMKEHGKRALAIAEHLKSLGIKVNYPGLETHPQHPVFNKIKNKDFGYGGILTIDCGTEEKTNKLMETLQNQEEFGLIAVSLGFYDTLMSCSASTTSAEVSEEKQKEIGLTPGLLRIAIGYTGSLDDRIKDMDRAVKQVLI